MSAPNDDAPYAGVVVLNYRLTDKLGAGGFGAVYLAVHEELGRRAAVKILRPEFARHREVVDRFFREAKAVCAIGHPVIVDVTNYGRLPSGEPFYMMDYVEGRSLGAWVQDRRRLALEQLGDVFGPIADALTAAHEKRIIHRDLKPDNIMLVEREGRIEDVRLLDFGIAKLMDSDATDSATGAAMGTPAYMAPEQARDAKSVDVRADVYGFAASIYAALVGQPPFSGASSTEILVAVQTQAAPRLRGRIAHAPAALDEILARCLEKDPEARPASMAEAWAAIAGAAAGARTPAAPPPRKADDTGPGVAELATLPAGMIVSPPTTLSAARGERTAQPQRRRTGWIGAGVGLVAVGLALFLWLRPRSAADPHTASPPQASEDIRARPPEPSENFPAGAAAPGPVGQPTAVPLAPPMVTPTAPTPAGDPARAASAPSPRPHKALPPGLKVSTPVATPVPPPAPTPAVTADKPPALDCSLAAFERIYRQPPPQHDAAKAALRKLKQCHDDGQIDDASYSRIQPALMKQL